MTNRSPRAAQFEAKVHQEYLLDPDSSALLDTILDTMDVIHELSEAQRGQPLIAKGSMGQAVIAPLVAELRQQRALLSSLLKRLGLPEEAAEDDDEVSLARSERARKAARARWDKRKGS
ncbi:hypothetical protein [Saccharomonospora glauca]|nr:hypothetical protein [Saccharomonospora glauca]